MNERIRQSLTIIHCVALVGFMTWALSWLLQYVCSITSTHQHFHLTSPETNRLAVATIIGAAFVMLAIMIALSVNGWWIFWFVLLTGSAIISGVLAGAHHAFAGTVVSTPVSQSVYGIIVFLWGALMWYIFLVDVTSELSELIEDEDDED